MFGSIFILKGLISAGDFIAYLLYVSTLLTSILRIIDFTEQFQKGMTGIDRFFEVMDTPIEIEDKENAIEIGALVGEVVDVDFTGNGEVCMCKFIRVKVEVKVDDPLRSGFYLDRSPQPDLWIQFKYERVAEFCYKCGRLGHLKARCLKVSHIDA